MIHVKSFDELTVHELYDILKLREAVFIIEQNCIYEDIDEKDKHSLHVFFKENNEIISYLRVLPKGISFDEVGIGRVVSKVRRKGLATQTLKAGILAAQQFFHADTIILEAQCYAKDLYAKQGFVQTSDEFLVDGIPHIQMTLHMK